MINAFNVKFLSQKPDRIILMLHGGNDFFMNSMQKLPLHTGIVYGRPRNNTPGEISGGLRKPGLVPPRGG